MELVLGQDGSLKAEHGTGRIMAPFVRRQYGDELYAVMQEVKRLCDPGGMLNPGVVLTDDADSHLQDLKPRRPVESEVDRCVECGFCEPVCPSRTSPPRRGSGSCCAASCSGPRPRATRRSSRELEDDYDYDGHRHLRGRRHVPDRLPGADQHRRPRQAACGQEKAGKRPRAGRSAARHWAGATRAASVALDVAAVLPSPLSPGRRRWAAR